MPLTVRSKLMTELLPAVRAGVRAAHLHAHYADDAVQQTCLALVPHLERLAAMLESERKAYVFVAASRNAMGLRKRLGAEEALGSDAEVAAWAELNHVPFYESSPPSPEQAFAAAERAGRAQAALDAMVTRDRELVHAVASDGLSERQAAEKLGVSRGGIAYRLRRARDLLGAAWTGTTSWARQRPRA
jgi:RNA polymerase sigma factor (sigma-70 family)